MIHTLSHRPTEILGLPVVAIDGALRLHPFTRAPACHGYANGCICDACDARAGSSALPAPEQPLQPWEVA